MTTRRSSSRERPINFLIATPLMNMITAFKLSFDEVRLGVTKIQTRRRDARGNPIFKNISQIGLNNTHIPLLYGITYPPERRTALLRGLGPLSLAIFLVQETQYRDKLKAALLNSISMLPMASQVVECLANATTLESVSGLLKELGDMLLVSSHRSVRRIHFPLECLMNALSGHPERMQALNFNGVNGMKFYIEYVRPVQMRLKSEAAIDRVRQVVFHAMFGSNMEDFGILAQ